MTYSIRVNGRGRAGIAARPWALLVGTLGLPAGLAAKLLGGYQEQRTANIFTALGSVLSLLAVLIVIAMLLIMAETAIGRVSRSHAGIF